MNQKVRYYYISLLSLVIFSVAITLFSGGTTVFNTQKIAQLKNEKVKLQKTQFALEQQLAATSALSTVDAHFKSDFEPIASVLYVDSHSSVAVVE